MKNKFSKLVLALILPLMAGCGNHTTSSSEPSSKTEEVSNNSSSANVEHRDYVHDGSVKLSLDYKGKDFYKDGIGQVELYSAIDGDTAHFTPLVTNTLVLIHQNPRVRLKNGDMLLLNSPRLN